MITGIDTILPLRGAKEKKAKIGTRPQALSGLEWRARQRAINERIVQGLPAEIGTGLARAADQRRSVGTLSGRGNYTAASQDRITAGLQARDAAEQQRIAAERNAGAWAKVPFTTPGSAPVFYGTPAEYTQKVHLAQSGAGPFMPYGGRSPGGAVTGTVLPRPGTMEGIQAAGMPRSSWEMLSPGVQQNIIAADAAKRAAEAPRWYAIQEAAARQAGKLPQMQAAIQANIARGGPLPEAQQFAVNPQANPMTEDKNRQAGLAATGTQAMSNVMGNYWAGAGEAFPQALQYASRILPEMQRYILSPFGLAPQTTNAPGAMVPPTAPAATGAGLNQQIGGQTQQVPGGQPLPDITLPLREQGLDQTEYIKLALDRIVQALPDHVIDTPEEWDWALKQLESADISRRMLQEEVAGMGQGFWGSSFRPYTENQITNNFNIDTLRKSGMQGLGYIFGGWETPEEYAARMAFETPVRTLAGPRPAYDMLEPLPPADPRTFGRGYNIRKRGKVSSSVLP